MWTSLHHIYMTQRERVCAWVCVWERERGRACSSMLESEKMKPTFTIYITLKLPWRLRGVDCFSRTVSDIHAQWWRNLFFSIWSHANLKADVKTVSNSPEPVPVCHLSAAVPPRLSLMGASAIKAEQINGYHIAEREREVKLARFKHINQSRCVFR